VKAMRRGSARLYRRMPCIALDVAAATLAFLSLAYADAPAALRTHPAPFSSMHPGQPVAPWTLVLIGVGKRATRYDLVVDDGAIVLHAVADNAASALAHPMHSELRDAPVVAWRWKIAGAISGADPHKASREDAPARLVLEFDGDRSRLPLLDRSIYGLARRAAGRELPYATLMYIWSSDERVGTVIANPHTRRIQMIVASNGTGGVNRWQSLARNVRADFLRAFGEEPGTLIAVGVLTDSDNTDGHAEAWYGDIRFEPAPH
jgi:hypothetical protein